MENASIHQFGFFFNESMQGIWKAQCHKRPGIVVSACLLLKIDPAFDSVISHSLEFLFLESQDGNHHKDQAPNRGGDKWHRSWNRFT